MAYPLKTFTEDAIYLDTMLPYMLVRGIDPAVKVFFEKIEHGVLIAYTSALTFDELAYRFLLALIKERHAGAPLDYLRANEEQAIAEFAPQIVVELNRLRTLPNLTVLDVFVSDLDVMSEAMTQYHLRPRDALHFAALQRVGCFALASNDPHFDRIPTIKRYTL
ncbi:MAG: type II toxin-antitoxin system VapC family toxin [Chloroflexi bacterium]|nr:type II toxin-antitoxin system VapC family toxin [Chloroflexota bacterium]